MLLLASVRERMDLAVPDASYRRARPVISWLNGRSAASVALGKRMRTPRHHSKRGLVDEKKSCARARSTGSAMRIGLHGEIRLENISVNTTSRARRRRPPVRSLGARRAKFSSGRSQTMSCCTPADDPPRETFSVGVARPRRAPRCACSTANLTRGRRRPQTIVVEDDARDRDNAATDGGNETAERQGRRSLRTTGCRRWAKIGALRSQGTSKPASAQTRAHSRSRLSRISSRKPGEVLVGAGARPTAIAYWKRATAHVRQETAWPS